MPRPRTRDQDGIHRRPDSPFWWATIPNGRGGSSRRSTGVAVAGDPQGLKAKAVRAAWAAAEPPKLTALGPTFDELLLAHLEQIAPTKRSPERDKSSVKKNGKPRVVPLNREAREALLSRASFRASHCPAQPLGVLPQGRKPHRAGEQVV